MDIIYKVFDDYIEFTEYGFKCSRVHKEKQLKAADIIDVSDRFFAPPAIRTIHGELILMPFLSPEEDKNGEDKKLPLFYEKNKINIREAVDIWDMILNPFLDTEHTEEFTEKTNATLEKYGISREECNSLRREVSARMIAYNFSSCLWDWCHLGLYDVLCASCGILSGEKHRLSDVDFEKFYWRAMDIALKGFI